MRVRAVAAGAVLVAGLAAALSGCMEVDPGAHAGTAVVPTPGDGVPVGTSVDGTGHVRTGARHGETPSASASGAVPVAGRTPAPSPQATDGRAIPTPVTLPTQAQPSSAPTTPPPTTPPASPSSAPTTPPATPDPGPSDSPSGAAPSTSPS